VNPATVFGRDEFTITGADRIHRLSIPGDWSPSVAGVFKKETMNNLADLGEKMGADPASWSDEPPGF
jgi:(p)ppGpp synthase/HD superfamily hydrolase